MYIFQVAKTKWCQLVILPHDRLVVMLCLFMLTISSVAICHALANINEKNTVMIFTGRFVSRCLLIASKKKS